MQKKKKNCHIGANQRFHIIIILWHFSGRDAVIRNTLVAIQFYDMPGWDAVYDMPGRDVVIRHALSREQWY